MICDQCEKEFEGVVVELEAGVKGDIVRVTNNLDNPCCTECLKDALVLMVKAIEENVFPW